MVKKKLNFCKKRQKDFKSDWRMAERQLESNYNKVLFFQRGDIDKGRMYIAVIGSQENIEMLIENGSEVIGFDIKQDLNAARF